MGDLRPPSIRDELPAQAAWMKRVARDLVRDDAAAEDLVQQTHLAALRMPPEGGPAPKAWLGRVLANFARRLWRDEHVRESAEIRGARPEAQPATSDVVARLDVQRALADELRTLAEPYRTTLLRRYFDGWSAARIAREQRVPAATVRWRLQRGLELLRERLDRRGGGDRTQWQLALLPLASAPLLPWPGGLPEVGTIRAIQGVLAMKAGVQAGVVAAVVAAVGIGVWWSVQEGGPAVPREASAAVAPALADPEPGTDAPAVREETAVVPRAAAPVVASEPAAEQVPAPQLEAALDGRLVDADQHPIAGGRVSELQHEPPASTTSKADGSIAMSCKLSYGEHERRILRIEAEGYGLTFQTVQLSRGTTTHLGDIVLPFGGDVRGRVEDVHGAPIAGARVVISGPDLFNGLDSSKRRGPNVWPGAPSSTSAHDGSFLVENVPAGSARAWAEVAGMRHGLSESFVVHAHEVVEDVRVTVEPLQREDEIAGRVLAPDGRPAGGTQLELTVTVQGSTWIYNETCDAQGAFRFRVMQLAPHQIVAQDRQQRWQESRATGVEPGTQDLVLRFAENRFVDVSVRSSGERLQRFAVVTRDETGARMIEGTGNLERAEGSGRVRVPAERFFVEVIAPGYAVERQGPFEPHDPPSELSFDLRPEPGVSGRVLSRGEPLAGAKVMLWRVAGRDRYVEVAGLMALVEPYWSDEFVTASDGSFFLRVRDSGSYVVRAEARDHAPGEIGPFELEPGRGVGGLELTLGGGGTIEGRVLVAPGKSPAGVIVAINRGDARARTTRSDVDGSFRFEGVTPGRWQVVRTAQEIIEGYGLNTSTGNTKKERILETNCEVVEGRATRVDVDLRDSEPCVLFGKLTVGGVAAKGWTLQVWPADTNVVANLPGAAVDENGEFQVEVPEPGPVRLSFRPSTDVDQQGRMDAQTDLRRGDNRWSGSFEMASLSGRFLAAHSADDSPYFYLVTEGEPTCTLALPRDAEGNFRLAMVPAGKGSVRRLDRKGEEGFEWVTVLEVELAAGEAKRVEVP